MIIGRILLLTSGLFVGASCANIAHGADAPLTIPKSVQTVLASYCVDCHGNTAGKGNVQLTNLEQLPLAERLPLLNQVQEQLFFHMMPPTKSDQPNATEMTTLREWVRGELQKHKASKLDDKMPYPDAGNYVDHDTLFNGKSTAKPYSPARRWLVRPTIFEERVLDLFQLQGREREQLKRSGFYGITNPFILPDHAGVRDYDLTPLDGSHLLVMRNNADWIATKQLHAARVKTGDAKMPTDPKDKWFPKETPAAFATIVLKKDAPTDAEINAAVATQFGLVLQRPPTEREQQAYRELTQMAIKLGGHAEGLRHMLLAVLLESEFLYRLEFGAGKADEHGRQLLAPREAAYAIAYALGDRGPDATLLKAAHDGHLTTKADFEREVRRLLDDKTYHRGAVDPTPNGLGFQATVATHPRINRFFREFFGYPAAVKVFKDSKRSGGAYVNADRGSTQTPGHLIDEADQVVDWVLAQDKDVFTQLLTTDRFFVYHTMDNEKGADRVAGWKIVYATLKNTDWRKNPQQVADEHQALLKKYIDPKGVHGKSTARHDGSLERWMAHFDYTFGHGLTPYTTPPWAHGNHYWYSPIYNLPKPPGREAKYGGDDRLDYQPVQPFALPNRKGLLTHPAWLVAFSSNFHNDTVRRGRWIREKLLAGYVPDVPITVDAKVPDDPPKTFRERLEHVTLKAECAKCHQHMNPLGMPLESYDDFGRYRTVEQLEHPDNLLKARPNDADLYKTKPVVTTGLLTGTGDPKLDGPVTDAFDLIDRLARSERVRQSIVRHAFRYYMGRNELLSDAPTLRAADQAYVQNGGSFKAVVVSLLTSDSFMYRKKTGAAP